MNPERKILVEVRNLQKTFTGKAKDLLVFDNLNFEILSGETICFLGPSGCGKSTLLRCLSGLTNYKGSVLIDGMPPSELRRNKKIGFAFQDADLIDRLNVYDNILLPSKIGNRTISAEEAEKRAQELVSIVGLEKFQTFFPQELSGGMRQRSSLARALLLKPQLMLLDEPFSALDSITRTKLTVQFDRILKSQQTTTVLISHSTEEAVYLADRIYILSHLPGRIIKEVTINFNKEKNISLFDDPEFSKIVATCRKELFKNEIE